MLCPEFHSFSDHLVIEGLRHGQDGFGNGCIIPDSVSARLLKARHSSASASSRRLAGTRRLTIILH